MGHLLPNLLAIAVGGALGALGRFAVSSAMLMLAGRTLPWGTLAVNVLGSLLIGVVFVAVVGNEEVRREWESVLAVGFLGAFTTFSTFSLEALLMLQSGRWPTAMLYTLVSVILCVAAVALGMRLGRGLL